MKNILFEVKSIPTKYYIYLIFFINFGFKLINLTAEPIWYDECFSIFYSQQPFSNILDVSKWEPPPPLFNLILHCWIKLFGVSEFGVRLFPALFSSLAGVVLYLFLKKFTTTRIAVTASVLYLFSDISFYYAQEVRCYSFVLFMSIVSAWVFIELVSKPNYKIAAGLGLTYYILIMTHYLAFFILLFQGIVFLIFFRKPLFKYYSISVGVFLLLITHWIPRMLEVARGDGNNHWLKSPAPDQLLQLIYDLNNGSTQLTILGLFAGISILVIMIKRLPLFENKETKVIFMYSICISIVTVLLSFFISAMVPIFLDRYLLFTLVGFVIFFSVCISSLPVRDSYYYILLAAIGLFAFQRVKLDVPTRKMDYRSAVSFVKQQQDSSSAVFIQTDDVMPLFVYYYDRSMFKDYDNIDSNRIAEKIFEGNDSTKLQKELNDSYPKIIHVETYSDATDPNKTVEAWFSLHGYKKEIDKNYIGVKVTVYRKDSDDLIK